MEPLLKTVIHDQHVKLGAQMVAFGGWNMPVQYRTGIVQEHLATRNHAGIFDVSHMGRIHISGPSALAFLQHVLSNNAAGLEVGESQYTIIPNEQGGAIDDAYLYRFVPDQYLLVINASNREKDLAHFQAILPQFPDVQFDRSYGGYWNDKPSGTPIQRHSCRGHGFRSFSGALEKPIEHGNAEGYSGLDQQNRLYRGAAGFRALCSRQMPPRFSGTF